jgi:hypothetical protein
VDGLKHNYSTKRDERTFIGPLGHPFGFLDTGHYNLTVFDFQLSVPKRPHTHAPHKNRDLAAAAAEAPTDGSSQQQQALMSEILDSIKGVGFLLKRFDDEGQFNHYMSYIQSDSSLCIFQQYLDEQDKNDDKINELMNLIDDDYMYEEDDDYVQDETEMNNLMNQADDAYKYNMEDDDFGTDDYKVDDLAYPGDDWNEQDGTDDTFRRRTSKQQRRQKRRRQQIEPQGYGQVLDTVEDGIFLDMMPRSRWRPHKPSVSYNFEPGEAGLYFLMYQVCYKDDVNKNKNQILDIHSRFELDFHFSNLDVFGNESYLSAGEMALPHMFFFFTVLYAICLFIWIRNIRLIKAGKPSLLDSGEPADAVQATPIGRGVQTPGVTIYPIHYLMGFLLTLKFLSLLFESIRYHYLRVTGKTVFWSAVYYSFTFLKVRESENDFDVLYFKDLLLFY